MARTLFHGFSDIPGAFARGFIFAIAAAAALSTPLAARAQTGSISAPIGFLHVSCLADSDTYVSVPFTRTAEFSGVIQSVSGNVVTVSGTTGWAANQFVYAQGAQPKTYYAILTSGTTVSPKDGASYTVTANSGTTLTLNLNGDDISSVPAGSAITVLPYWTLNTLFPAASAGVSFTPSAGSSGRTRATQILFPDFTDPGVNLAPPVGYYFYNGAWRQAGGDPTVDVGDTVIGLDGYIIVRNVSAPTTLTVMGAVPLNPVTTPLATQPAGGQDNPSALLRPINVTLDNLGLITSNAFTASSGSSPQARGDELLVYDNTTSGINKSAAAVYYYFNGAWRLDGGDPTVDQGSIAIPAGAGFTIRKAQTSNGASAIWENTATYTDN